MAKNTQKRGRPPKSPESKMSELLTVKMTKADMAELNETPVPNLRTWCRETLLKASRRLRRHK